MCFFAQVMPHTVLLTLCSPTISEAVKGEDKILGNIGLLLLLQLVLVLLNAVFACAEIAMLSANETRMHKLAEEGNRRAKRLCKLIEQPARFLAAIQVAITLSGFLGSAFAAENFSDPLVDWLIGLGVNIPRSTLNTIAVIFITLILSYVTLIFGELVPKRVAMKKADALSLRISGIVGGISTVFAPVVWLLSVQRWFCPRRWRRIRSIPKSISR